MQFPVNRRKFLGSTGGLLLAGGLAARPLKAAEKEAQSHWISQAKEIVEPSREEIRKSCKTYLAMKKVMLEHGAQAITVKQRSRTSTRS